jgi:hypothetical protein
VRERELGGGLDGLEDVPGGLELLSREIRVRVLPVAPAEDDPEPSRLDPLAKLLEGIDALAQVAGSSGCRPVQPMVAADASHGERAPLRIAQVRKDPLEQPDRLPECGGPLGVLRARKTDRHGLIESPGA